MRTLCITFLLWAGAWSMYAQQQALSLDSCRALAIAHNKQLLISNEKMVSAYNQRKAAFTNYLPKISASGTYAHTFRRTSLISGDVASGLNQMGTTAEGSILQFAQSISSQYPDMADLLNSLGGNLATPLNSVGSELVHALQPDMRNMFMGMVTLTQPLYMGGKIRAYNKITRYAEELSKQEHQTDLQETILNTDQAYWQVVSLVYKKTLAETYLNLLNKTDSDMNKMIDEGMATIADGLSVRVKVNEAEMTLTKVDNGLALARMLLCQICGLELNTPIVLADETFTERDIPQIQTSFTQKTRPEIRSLELGTAIYKQNIALTRSEFLPSLGLTGGYLVSNPSIFNGFERKFRGTWNIGVSLKIPLVTWGESTYKIRAAKAEARMAEYRLSDAKEQIELQVSQSYFKVNEAEKKFRMAVKNKEKAEENLRFAQLGFKEGVIPILNLMEAQTAWLSAQSEKIDAQIDIMLTQVYLKRALGSLTVE